MSNVDMFEIMRMSRRDRRAFAKINGLKKVVGSRKPYKREYDKKETGTASETH